jgi:16S rRNA (guanine966-N2)-methyltransferase
VGSLRIIAGSLKGRRLQVPPADEVRPTGDRVREALFSILAGRLDEARVLDAYAGSGALGFEALSRGAREAVFVEADRRVLATLRDNATALGVSERCRVVAGDPCALLGARVLGEPFDLVLADPPYAAGAGPRLLRALADAGALAAGGWAVIEREGRRSVAPAPPTLQHLRTALYGRAALDFYARDAP